MIVVAILLHVGGRRDVRKEAIRRRCISSAQRAARRFLDPYRSTKVVIRYRRWGRTEWPTITL
jgi:hypothetical protein